MTKTKTTRKTSRKTKTIMLFQQREGGKSSVPLPSKTGGNNILYLAAAAAATAATAATAAA